MKKKSKYNVKVGNFFEFKADFFQEQKSSDHKVIIALLSLIAILVCINLSGHEKTIELAIRLMEFITRIV